MLSASRALPPPSSASKLPLERNSAEPAGLLYA